MVTHTMEDVKIQISAEPIETVDPTSHVQEMEAATESVSTPVTGQGAVPTLNAWW